MRLQDHAAVSNDQANTPVFLIRQNRCPLQGTFKFRSVRLQLIRGLFGNDTIVLRKPAIDQLGGKANAFQLDSNMV